MISSPKKESLESAEFFVVINLLLTRVSGGSRQQYPFYQPPRRFSRGFPEFQYHREIRGHLKRSAKYGDFALRVQGRNRHSRGITMDDFMPATVLGYSEWPKHSPNYWALPA